jgi:hypothetical protein
MELKRFCLSCRWAYKAHGMLKCGFPVPFWIKMKMDNQIHATMIEMMSCEVWERKTVEVK